MILLVQFLQLLLLNLFTFQVFKNEGLDILDPNVWANVRPLK